MPKWINAKLIRTEDHSSTTRSFWFELDVLTEFSFKAGQFVTFDLPIGEKRLDRWRSYSIANAPDKSKVIELVIVRVPEGRATGFLFDKCPIGTSLPLKGPAGAFTLNETSTKDLVMICTGTGVAPFRSMLAHMDNQSFMERNTHLIFGTRYKSGILYLDEFAALEKKHPSFKYSVALSREEYNGYSGYVHGVYEKDYADSYPDIVFYLCGWQNMVDETKDKLLSLGYDKSQIIEELYG